MKNIITASLLLCSFLYAENAVDEKKDKKEETLEEALSIAYQNNPAILSERAGKRATDEDAAQAYADWRPSVSGEVSSSRSWTRSAGSSAIRTDSKQGTVSASWNLYKGGATVLGTGKADDSVAAAEENLINKQQGVLLKAIESFLNVLTKQEVVELQKNNLKALQAQLKEKKIRAEVGDITISNVYQVEAKAKDAEAKVISAENSLSDAHFEYQKLIGKKPGTLKPPALLPEIPKTREELVSLALKSNPQYKQAYHQYRAAKKDVGISQASFLPSVDLQASYTHTNPTPKSSTSYGQRVKTVKGTVSIPIFNKGINHIKVRKSRQSSTQLKLALEDARRSIINEANKIWDSREAITAQVETFKSQVRYAKTALAGIVEEARVGVRTTLDVLSAETEKLQAQVSLTEATNKQKLVTYQILALIGKLDPHTLKLSVKPYDSAEHYDRVKGMWVGWSVD